MHREYEDLLLLYTTNSIDQADRQRLEEHLQTCETCRASLKEWRAISAAVRRSANQRADSLPALRLPEQEKNTMQSTYVFPQRRNYVPVTFAAIAAMLILAAAIFFTPKPENTAVIMLQSATETPASAVNITATPRVYVDLVIASQPIENGDVIQSEDVTMYSLPQEAVPFNALAVPEDAIGKIARTNIPCGTVILSNMLVQNARDVSHNVPSIRGDCQYVDLSPLEEPVEFVDVVIAVQEIPRGSIIPRNALSARPYPAQLVSADTITGSPDDLAGNIAHTDIFREQMIQIPYVGAWSVENPPPFMLPEGMVAVSLPMERVTSVAYALQEQDRVDLIATLFFIDDEEGRRLLLTDTPGAAPVTIQMVTDARIVHIGEFPQGVYIGESPSESGENSYDVITFAVSSQEAAILNWLIAAEVPVTIALTGNTELPRAETTPPIIPDSLVPEGMEVVYVPLDRITPVYGQENVVDIYAPKIGELLDTTPVAPVLSADGSYLAPGEMVQVAQNAQIIPSSGRSSLLPVAVSPDEVELLRRLIEGNFPLTLVDAGLIERTLDSTPTAPVEVPEGMVAVSVPRTLILAAPVGQLSDHVDILATLRFADIDEEFQGLVPIGTPPDTQAVTQQVISNALQIPSDDPDTMTFVVSPEDAEVLAWLIEARTPLILVSPGSWNGDPLNIPTIP